MIYYARRPLGVASTVPCQSTASNAQIEDAIFGNTYLSTNRILNQDNISTTNCIQYTNRTPYNESLSSALFYKMARSFNNHGYNHQQNPGFRLSQSRSFLNDARSRKKVMLN